MSPRNERSNAKCEPGNIFAVSGDRNPMPNVTAGFRTHWAVDNATANAIVAFLAHFRRNRTPKCGRNAEIAFSHAFITGQCGSECAH